MLVCSWQLPLWQVQPRPRRSRSQTHAISLDSCKQLALQNNRKIKEAELQVQASGQQRMEVFTNFFPKVSAVAFAMRSADYLIKAKTPAMNLPVWNGQDPSQLVNPTQFAYIPSISLNLLDYLNTAAVTVAMPVYAGGRIRRGYKLARLGEDVNVYQKAMTTDEVLGRTEELFWTLQSLKEKEQTIKELPATARFPLPRCKQLHRVPAWRKGTMCSKFS